MATKDELARKLRGFGPIGIAVFVLILLPWPNWFKAILILVWAKLSATPWRELGLARPPNWLLTVVGGAFFGVSFKLLMKSVVMPLLGADPINHAYHFLVGNGGALVWLLFFVTISGGLGEEIFFRGYLFERLGKLMGNGVAATISIILLTSALFAAAHYPDQGVVGVEQATVSGVVFGTIFAITRQLWLPIVAHAAFDIAAVVIIYCDREWEIAHWFFK